MILRGVITMDPNGAPPKEAAAIDVTGRRWVYQREAYGWSSVEPRDFVDHRRFCTELTLTSLTIVT